MERAERTGTLEPNGAAADRLADALALLDGLPDATVLIRGDGTVRWMNTSAEIRVGRPREEFIGRSGLDLIHPDDLGHAAHSLESVVDKRVGTPIEVRVRTATGWRLAEVIGAPLPDGDIVLTMRDLTERRRWEVASGETAKLRTLVHHAPTLFLLLDGGRCVSATSGAITRSLDYDQAAVEGRSVLDLVHAGDRPVLASALDRAVSGSGEPSQPTRVEVRLRINGTNDHIPFELSILDRTDDPTVGGVIVTGHDVSDRVAAEGELHEMVSLLHATLDSTVDGVLVVDNDGRVTSFNERFAQMWGLPQDRVHDSVDDELLQQVAVQLVDPEQFVEKVRDLYAHPETPSFDVLTFRDGRVYERSAIPQRVDGVVVGRVWSFHDITRQKQLEAELEHQAFHDSLTGLSNQALFRDRVAHALTRTTRGRTTLAVLYFDIDDFKRVNDSLGHPVGDDLLVVVAERLRASLRGTDTAARLGGDEFAVLIEDLEDPEEATVIARRLVEELGHPFRVGDRDLATSVSVGVAFSTPDSDVDQLLRNADLAMYSAKHRGKGTYSVYEPSMHADAVARLELDSDLRHALDRNELWLAYQPVVELDTGRIAGVEALLRWRHPELGDLLPGSFLHAAAEMRLMGGIGDHVLEVACAQATEWRALGSPLRLSVNVAPAQLTDGSIVHQVGDHLTRSGLDPHHLVIELTETAMLHDTRAARRTLQALDSLGVRIALDDFGTGFSSLTHLQQFPIHILKIDRSFMTTDDRDATLVRALVNLADQLGLTVVAEGVETRAHADFLHDVGCRLGQGHYFGAPVRASGLTPLLASRLPVPVP